MSDRFQPFDRSDLDRSLHGCFTRQARRQADRPAVQDRHLALSYAALDDHANAIAGRLMATGRGGTRTALLLPQGSLLTAALLGVLKTGGAYVPLDARRPIDGNAWQIEDADCDRVLCRAEDLTLARTIAGERARVLVIGVPEEGATAAPVDVAVDPGAMACIYYTSGSTGKPKGVCDSHRNILHNIMRYTNSLRIAPDDCLSLIQSPVFSGTLSSLFGALLNGATLACLAATEQGLESLGDWIRQRQITVYHSVPSIFRTLCVGTARYPSVRMVRLEGDQASNRDFELFRRHFGPGCTLAYGLGATECGLVRQHFFDTESEVRDGVLPLGTSLPDVETRILGERDDTLPTGEIGEVAIRSRYLAMGYWRAPALTTERFLSCADGSGERVYRTGDLGKLTPDGCLHYCGRVDQQRRIDGQHVEIARVETLLRSLPDVADAIAQTRADDPDHPRLVAYLVVRHGQHPTLESVRAALAPALPPHMVPTRIVRLERIPLTVEGKVDRKALPPPGKERPPLESVYLPPRSATEITLVALWEELLGITPVGIDDNFLNLGGTSLLAAEFLVRLRDSVGIRLGPALVYECATIEKLAARIDGAVRRTATAQPAAAKPSQGGSSRRSDA